MLWKLKYNAHAPFDRVQSDIWDVIKHCQLSLVPRKNFVTTKTPFEVVASQKRMLHENYSFLAQKYFETVKFIFSAQITRPARRVNFYDVYKRIETSFVWSEMHFWWKNTPFLDKIVAKLLLLLLGVPTISGFRK